ncbi:hypothetical protein POSPLADRAFT_1050466 [Postia placenta MAD-698-R-SB12]|uniref:Heme haloperoxidase family profile domain-containing protein n=1 Tax=Postia placenta MAD-698-R-SB12 TaxID=670580 RepID=A0A1X6MKJ6_9APHY|nr:hypothetical protein POSPLADRAFT_1050466 [Postia placenta MAD-698-R-SB12]OSX56776.1 hypothetical protein POSPLADRAFT_1050466 [Postia placenta MAD-698-R-SB12]
MPPFIIIASTRLTVGLISSLLNILTNLGVVVWDLGLTLFNLVAPLRPADRVVPAGCPGAGGRWPEYIPPKEGDSRSACPGLNALANHGLLPRSGRNISFRQMNAAIRSTFNFAPTFCFFVPSYMAGLLGKSYWTDTLDLSDISVHNGIEHDASLTREDTSESPHQGEPCERFINELLASGTGPGGNLTVADLSRISGKRRTEAKSNGQFTLSAFHKLFGSSNSGTLLTIFGGRVQDLRPILLEERIPEGWQPRIRNPAGLTLTAFQPTVLGIELGIEEEAS